MEFEINEWAVHPRHGVGRIVKVEAKHFDGGPERQYYRLEIPTGTVWIPVDSSPGGLRRLFAKKDIAAYRDLLRSRPTPLETDHRQRQITLTARQKQGSFKSRCELVRDLTAFGWKKSLNEITSVMLQGARHALCAEWAAVEGLSIDKARMEVDALLLEGRKTYEQRS
ncbi:MAG: CarD family transcriptional regulator [Anaerolineales bacterium]|jgi:RNA polymerase-interacting CarD/CdnL/TRCF family regulator